ncbi:hypothetical protein T09_8073 [Trichinella sp. T9]|nr:hypothetical protein T09_8073 [Trichinella sp. T9]
MKGKHMLVLGWDNLIGPIPVPAVTLNQQPHISLDYKNEYITGQQMIHLKMPTRFCSCLLSSESQILPPGWMSWVCPGSAIVHCSGPAPTLECTRSI